MKCNLQVVQPFYQLFDSIKQSRIGNPRYQGSVMVDPPVDFQTLFAHDNLKSHAENTQALISTPDTGQT
jgi:hypothetical protein